MSWDLPKTAPKTTGEAFAYVGKLANGATIDDLKILALVEALGLALYEDMASQTDNPGVQALLRANGREEMAHAHRVAKALEILTGKAYPIPAIADNPLYTSLPPMPVTAETLGKLAQAELAGQDLYAGIAGSFDNADVIALMQQNGREEVQHGHRLLEAVALLDA